MQAVPQILTIAGSDSGGGAGIQADIKTIASLGGYASSVITALTAQNSLTVTGVHAPSAEFVALQLNTVLDDMDIKAIKTGMLFSAPIIESIVMVLSEKKIPLVVDPVCVATTGAILLKEDALCALRGSMLPLADILTPNIPEAEALSCVEITDEKSLLKAGEKLLSLGAKSVIIKGGHGKDKHIITDWFFEQGQIPEAFPKKYIDTKNTHGTGCTLSAAIAFFLGCGFTKKEAFKKAQNYLHEALLAAYPVGKGFGPVNHGVLQRTKEEILALLDEKIS